MKDRGVLNVDGIARAMTAGSPSPNFTARVMAPIHGRPRPDFTARVMQRLAAAEHPANGARVWRRALLLVPAALALALGVVAMRAARVTMLTVPAAPVLAVAASPRIPVASEPVTISASHTLRPAPRSARAPRNNVVIELPAIYTIAALDGPEAIGITPIEPPTASVPPLAGPAPLKVTDLPGAPGGSRDQEFKERP